MKKCCQILVLKTFIKLLVYIYTNVQLCLNFIFIILVTSFNFEAQIIYLWSLKLFKVNEILCVLLLILYVIQNLYQICVHCSLPATYWIKPLKVPYSYWWQINWPFKFVIALCVFCSLLSTSNVHSENLTYWQHGCKLSLTNAHYLP